MEEWEVEFHTRLEKLNIFETELRYVFEKHNVTLKNEVEMWHGGSKDIIEVFIDGEKWIGTNFDEVLKNIGVIE